MTTTANNQTKFAINSLFLVWASKVMKGLAKLQEIQYKTRQI